MPSKTPAQARLMAAKCHNPGSVRAKGLSQSVACEFNRHDKGTGILKSSGKSSRFKKGHGI